MTTILLSIYFALFLLVYRVAKNNNEPEIHALIYAASWPLALIYLLLFPPNDESNK